MPKFTRNSISLNVQGTNGAEYYDQICAISQATINKNFEVLFQQRKELVELWYKDKRGNGSTLDAILDPPQVKLKLGSSDMPEIYFEIHIKSGSIKLAADQIQTIDSWVITVRSQLFDSQVSPAPQGEEEAAAAALELDEIKKSYNIDRLEAAINDSKNATIANNPKTPTALKAGDYSIQRLFCVVAQGQWSTPDERYSFLPDPDDKTKRISIEEWRSSNRNSRTRLVANAVSKLLGNWAEDNQESAFWNLGIQVRLPVEKVLEEQSAASCAPTAVRLQNYAYIGKAASDQENNNGGLGHPQNCLVFCETVNRGLPTGSRLVHGGNLAEPANSPLEPGVPGTFVLDHRLYLEKKILNHLRELCVKTSVIPLYPKMFTNDSSGEQQFQSRFVVGSNPQSPNDYPGLPDQNASNSTFDFSWEKNGKYAWRRKYPAPGSDSEVKTYTNCNSAPVYRKWSINANNAVEVTWEPGSNKLQINGRVDYDHWEAYQSKDLNFDWGSLWGCMWGQFAIRVSWSFQIQLCDTNVTFEQRKRALEEEAQQRKKGKIPLNQPSKIANGIIQPIITGLDNNTGLPSDLEVTSRGGKYVLDETDKKMKREVERSLREGFKKACPNIKASLQHAGRFIYPGTRTLVFDNPQISDYGDIIATIDYLDLDDNLVTVNAPVDKEIEKSTSQTNDPVISDSTVTGNPAHVTWSPKITYYPAGDRATLILEGRNNAPDPMAFEEVAVQFLPTNGKNCLFSASAYNWVFKEELDEKRRIARQAKSATDREEAAKPGVYSSNDSTAASVAGAADATQEEVPHSTYDFLQKQIKEDLRVTPDQEDNSSIFRIEPVPPPKKGKKTPRFTIPPGGYFSLTLDGTVSEPGSYIAQLDELWNHIDYNQNMKGKRAASTFLKFVFTMDAEGTVYQTSQADADATRGVTES